MEMQAKRYKNMQYLIRYPEGYQPGQRCPVIFFLHGAGTRGNDLSVLENNLYFSLTARHASFPFVTVAPLCAAECWFDVFETLKELFCSVAAAPFADPERLYVMGASMGGYATWQLGMSLPEWIAAMIPICGGGMYWDAGRLVNVPVWAFHGQKDPTVFVEESVRMTEAVRRCGGTAKLTLYPENGHDAWSDTYADPTVFAWLLQHRNENVAALAENFCGSGLYG